MEHKAIFISEGMTDMVKCSCGKWESKWYFDGMGWATDRWKKHKKHAEEEEAIDAMWHT